MGINAGVRVVYYNERGNLASAVIFTLVAIMSGISLTIIVMADTVNLRAFLDLMQETHLLRSEMDRGTVYLRRSTISLFRMQLPYHRWEIETGDSRTTYISKSYIQNKMENGLFLSANQKEIKCKIRAFRKDASFTVFSGVDDNRSKMEKYAEREFNKETFAGFMYITESDISVNDGPVYFWGQDEIWGRVHSNSTIWIQERGGGWPLFHEYVTTHQTIEAQSGSIPYDEVFLNGYAEEVGYVEFNPTAELVRAHGRRIDGTYDLAYVVVDGIHYTIRTAIFQENVQTLTVYDDYPPYGPVGNSIGSNTITFVDTVWNPPLTGTLQNGSMLIESEMWIRGNFSGAQTWASSGDMYLVDDITLTGTPELGVCPDGFNPVSNDFSLPLNRNDYVGLVSERRIFIAYAYREPDAVLAQKPNCNNIFIYAALAALGHGDGWEDGIFTFQYHYPHFSTPHQYGFTAPGAPGPDDYLYPDLHRAFYPPADPPYWPHPINDNIDYPFYNPIYPESNPTWERGDIRLFGSVAQHRRGFVHRSGNSSQDAGYWDMDDPRFGPIPNGSAGYGKDYHYDHRFMKNPPPDYPEVKIREGETPYSNGMMKFKEVPEYF